MLVCYYLLFRTPQSQSESTSQPPVTDKEKLQLISKGDVGTISLIEVLVMKCAVGSRPFDPLNSKVNCCRLKLSFVPFIASEPP